MRKIDRRIVIVVSVIFIVGLAYGLMKFLIAQKEDPPQRRSMEARRFVKTEVVEYKTIPAEVSETGRLSAVAEIDIVAEASGKIEAGEVSLKKGSNFSRGQVLFRVYPDEAILALKARKSKYQNSLASILPDLKIDFPEHVEDYKDFFDAISVDKALPTLPEINNDQLKIFLASRNVIAEYYQIQKDELQLERRTVRAPFAGTFLAVYMEPGAYTNTGGRVARAIRTDRLELEVPLERDDASWIQIGDPVIVHSENRDLTWDGKVIRKSQFVDENTQSQAIFVTIPNQKSHSLLVGEYLKATFPVRPIQGIMEIPRNSVFNSNEVFLVKKGRLQKAMIVTVKENEKTLFFNGLPEGDTLVVQQLINVSEGTLVTMGEEPRKNRPQGGDNKAPDSKKAPPGGKPGGPDKKSKAGSES